MFLHVGFYFTFFAELFIKIGSKILEYNSICGEKRSFSCEFFGLPEFMILRNQKLINNYHLPQGKKTDLYDILMLNNA